MVAWPPALPPLEICGPWLATVALPPAECMAAAIVRPCARGLLGVLHVGERCGVHNHLKAVDQHELESEGEEESGVDLRGVGPAR